MYKGDAVEKMIEKSKGLKWDIILQSLGMNSAYLTMLCADSPIDIVRHVLDVNEIDAAHLLNVIFNLGVEDNIKPSEYERMAVEEAEMLKRKAAEEAEALRRKEEASIELFDWAHVCLNEKKPSSAMQDTWAYKALKAMGATNIDELGKELKEYGLKGHSPLAQSRIANVVTALGNIRAALEAAQ